MAIGVPPTRVLRPSRRAITAWTLFGAVLGTSVAGASLLLMAKRHCPDILVTSVERFTVIDESTRRPICDAMIDWAGKGPEAIIEPGCSYEIELNNLNRPVMVTVSRKGYLTRTITLRENAKCVPMFGEFPSQVMLARHGPRRWWSWN